MNEHGALRSNDLLPREQMLNAVRADEVSSEALLAILLKTGVQGCDVCELSRRLLDCFGSVAALVKCDWRTIAEKVRSYNEQNPERKILGLGQVKLLELAASFELGRRGYDEGAQEVRKRVVNSPAIAAELFWRQLRGWEEQENFLVLLLDAARHPLACPICLVRGTLDSAVVHPREVFKEAVRWGAHSLVVAHNHPSGVLKPSKQDRELTSRLRECSMLMQIPLVDHLLLGEVEGERSFVSIGRE